MKPAGEGMVFVPGGAFLMGSDRFYPEERPRRPCEVAPFYLDRAPVTNADFAAFVDATGYVTDAERGVDGPPGSLVFQPPRSADDIRRVVEYWSFVPGASWRRPTGPDSSLEGLADHPVVHVTLNDAQAFARWQGKSLPTEAQWEYAAGAGHRDADYAWGDALAPGGAILANYWVGEFPFAHAAEDQFERTSPVGAFPADSLGLVDMIGNVWELTADLWTLPSRPKTACCAGRPLQEPARDATVVVKGGSHLCSSNHCQRYRPAARHPLGAWESTSHVGFRCALAA